MEEFDRGFEEGLKIYINEFGIREAIDVDKLIMHSKEYSNIIEEMTSLMESKQLMSDDKIRGFLFELFQEGTFNIDAIKNGSVFRAAATGTNDSINDLEVFDLRSGEVVLIHQLKNAKADTIKEAIREHPGYAQTDGIIINTDVYNEIYTYLDKQITKSTSESDRLLYQMMKEGLDTKIEIDDGGILVSSLPISKENMHKLVLDMRDQINENRKVTKLDLRKYIDLDMYSNEMILKSSLVAGTNAALLTFIIKFTPYIIEFIIEEKKINRGDVLDIFTNSSSEAFLRGTLTSSFMLLCKSGKLGNELVNVSPEIVTAVVFISLNSVKEIYSAITGEIEYSQCIENIVKNAILVGCALKGKIIGTGIGSFYGCPAIGALIGSFVGSAIGSIVIRNYNNSIISISLETGYTMFGLVKQDYQLPEEVIINMGLDLLEIETYEEDEISVQFFEDEGITLDIFEFNGVEMDVKMVKRGLIGIRKIGYV